MGDEGMIRMGKTGLGPEPWLSQAVADSPHRGIVRVRSGRQSSRVGMELNAGNKVRGQCSGMEAFGPETDALTVLFSVERESRGKKG